MNIDAKDLWNNFDYWVKTKQTNIKKLCIFNPDLNYGTVTQNRSKEILPSLFTTINICLALSITVEQLLNKEVPAITVSPEAQLVQDSDRYRRIFSVLKKAPEKLDALETFLDIKHIPVGGGSTEKLRKAQM
jgi:hypothetical protein